MQDQKPWRHSSNTNLWSDACASTGSCFWAECVQGGNLWLCFCLRVVVSSLGKQAQQSREKRHWLLFIQSRKQVLISLQTFHMEPEQKADVRTTKSQGAVVWRCPDHYCLSAVFPLSLPSCIWQWESKCIFNPSVGAITHVLVMNMLSLSSIDFLAHLTWHKLH